MQVEQIPVRNNRDLAHVPAKAQLQSMVLTMFEFYFPPTVSFRRVNLSKENISTSNKNSFVLETKVEVMSLENL